MKEVPLCNIALSSDVAADEIESLISAIKLTSAKVQKEPPRVLGVDDAVTIITILVGVGQLTEYSIRISKALKNWRNKMKERAIEAPVKLEHPDRPALNFLEATDEEIQEWLSLK